MSKATLSAFSIAAEQPTLQDVKQPTEPTPQFHDGYSLMQLQL